jgi:hypothetical protein
VKLYEKVADKTLPFEESLMAELSETDNEQMAEDAA